MQEIKDIKQYFLNDIKRQSQAEIERLKQEQEAVKEKAIAEIHEEAQKEAKAFLEQELKDLTAEYTVKNSRINEERNRRLMQERDALTAEIFMQASKKLQAFVQTDAYVRHMKQKLSQLHVSALTEDVVFYIGACDEQRYKEIFQGFDHVKVEVDPHIQLGGFRMEDERAGMVVDETLDTHLEDEKAWFYANSSLAVRG